MGPTGRGHYLGTEIDETWWRRYRRDHLFARGNSTYRFDEEGLSFKRFLLKPLHIPFAQVTQVKLGKWHAGRWCMGRPVLKLFWEKDGQQLSSGFILTRTWPEAEELQGAFQELASRTER